MIKSHIRVVQYLQEQINQELTISRTLRNSLGAKPSQDKSPATYYITRYAITSLATYYITRYANASLATYFIMRYAITSSAFYYITRYAITSQGLPLHH